MKKPYLIGLLGLAAISIPLGNSLLDSNKQMTPTTESGDSAAIETTSPSVTTKNEDVTETTAAISYIIDPGTDENTQPYKVTSVEWVDNNENAFGNTEAITDGEPEGKFTANGLAPNKTYNTELQVIYTDSNDENQDTLKQKVDPITTDSHKEVSPTIDPTIGTIEEETITDTTATVSYVINPGEDSYNKDYKVTSVEWVDNNKNAFGNTEAIIDGEPEGKFTATGLDPKTTYNTELQVIYTDSNDENQDTLTQKVDPITTDSHKEVSPTIVPTIGTIEEETITDTTATVSYVINPGEDSYNKDYKVTSVEWVDNNKNAFGNTEAIIDGEPEGKFTATGLDPKTTYNTKLIVSYTDSSDENQDTLTQKVDPITTDSHKEVSPTIVPTIGTIEEETITDTTATVSYVINPGEDSYNKDYKVTSVEWVDNNKNAFGNTEAIIDGEPEGKFTATGLDPKTTYNTKLIVSYTDSSDENQDTLTQKVDPITTDSHKEVSPTIVPTIGTIEEETITDTTATVSYVINPGEDSYNKDYKVTSVEWVDNNKNAFGNTEAIIDGEPEGKFTATGLDPKTTYNTKLIVSYTDSSDENQDTLTQKVDPITTDSHKEVSPTIVPTIGTIEEETITDTTATVSYVINPGEDSYNKDYKVTSVEWVDNNKNAFGNTEAIIDGEPEGKFTATGLDPKTTYNTKLIVSYTDSSDENQDTLTQKVDPITTDSHKEVSPTIVPTIGTIEEETITDTTATVSYVINPGEDSYNKDYKVTSVEWVDNNKNAFGNTEAIIDGEPEGKFTATGLDPKTTYNTKLIVSYTDSSDENQDTLTQKVDPITTDAIEPISPTVNIESTEITETTATFNYNIDPGKDSYGKEYKLSKVEIVDEKNGIAIEYNNEQEKIPLSGELTLEGLNPNVKYDLTVTYTYVDSHGENQSEFDQYISFQTLKDGLGGWAIFGIIVGALLFVGIIAWGLTYLSNKYNKDDHKDKKVETK